MQRPEPGSKDFLLADRIDIGIRFVARELVEEAALQGLVQEKFVERLAYFYGEFNHVHPFREGNGRAQRLFWSRITHRADFYLDWTQTSREENDKASRQAMTNDDLTFFVKMFRKVVRPPQLQRFTSFGDLLQ